MLCPVNETIFENFVENVQQSPTAFGVLRYVADIFATNNRIYLLWNGTSEKSQQTVQVSSDGEINNIYHLPDYDDFTFDFITLDENSNRLYLGSQISAKVYTTVLSD